mgnify:CR=1 FL=1
MMMRQKRKLRGFFRVMDVTEDFGEAQLPQSDFVLMLARAVGFVVAIVAVILAILLMVLFRTLLALFVTKLGVIGLSIICGALIYGISLFSNAKIKSIWIVFFRSCM